MSKKRIPNLVLCGLFTALIAVGAFIRIDLIVPITLQSLFVVLAGLLLGARNGAAGAGAYMVLGLAGLPVFAGGGGLMYIFRPSFGYIIGFILGAFVTGLLAERRKNPTAGHLYLSALAGLGCIYAIGMAYFCLVMLLYLKADMKELTGAMSLTLLVTLPTDLLLMIPAVLIAKRVLPVIRRQRV